MRQACGCRLVKARVASGGGVLWRAGGDRRVEAFTVEACLEAGEWWQACMETGVWRCEELCGRRVEAGVSVWREACGGMWWHLVAVSII